MHRLVVARTEPDNLVIRFWKSTVVLIFKGNKMVRFCDRIEFPTDCACRSVGRFKFSSSVRYPPISLTYRSFSPIDLQIILIRNLLQRLIVHNRYLPRP